MEQRSASVSPLFCGGDTGISTARVIRTLRVHPAHQLPGTMGNWMDRVESNYKMELSDQEEFKQPQRDSNPCRHLERVVS